MLHQYFRHSRIMVVYILKLSLIEIWKFKARFVKHLSLGDDSFVIYKWLKINTSTLIPYSYIDSVQVCSPYLKEHLRPHDVHTYILNQHQQAIWSDVCLSVCSSVCLPAWPQCIFDIFQDIAIKFVTSLYVKTSSKP